MLKRSVLRQFFQASPAHLWTARKDLLGPSIRRLLEQGLPSAFEEHQLEIWLWAQAPGSGQIQATQPQARVLIQRITCLRLRSGR